MKCQNITDWSLRPITKWGRSEPPNSSDSFAFKTLGLHFFRESRFRGADGKDSDQSATLGRQVGSFRLDTVCFGISITEVT